MKEESISVSTQNYKTQENTASRDANKGMPTGDGYGGTNGSFAELPRNEPPANRPPANGSSRPSCSDRFPTANSLVFATFSMCRVVLSIFLGEFM